MRGRLRTNAMSMARTALRRAAFSLAGLVCLAVGAGFLTAAGWMVLAEMRSALFATVICGIVYSGLGLVLVALSGAQPQRAAIARKRRDAEERATQVSAVVSAFSTGMSAGMKR